MNRCGDDQDEYLVATESETAETVQRLFGAEREKTTCELTLERAIVCASRAIRLASIAA